MNKVFVALRHVIVLGWIAAAIAAVVHLPTVGVAGDLGLPLPDGAAPLTAEERATDTFGYPLLARTQIIVRDPGGISVEDQAALGDFAPRVTRGGRRAREHGRDPLTNETGIAPGYRENGTAVLTYLLVADAPSIPRQMSITETYAPTAPGRAHRCHRLDPRARPAAQHDRGGAARRRGPDPRPYRPAGGGRVPLARRTPGGAWGSWASRG